MGDIQNPNCMATAHTLTQGAREGTYNFFQRLKLTLPTHALQRFESTTMLRHPPFLFGTEVSTYMLGIDF